MIMSTLGLDNIAVAFALGPLQLGPRRTLLLGLCVRHRRSGHDAAWVGTRPGVASGGDDDRDGARGRARHAGRRGAWSRLGQILVRRISLPTRGRSLGLALLLGVDNLVAGTAPDMAGVSLLQIVANGAMVGALAAAACAVGGAAFRPARRWGAVASGLMLLGLAAAGIS